MLVVVAVYETRATFEYYPITKTDLIYQSRCKVAFGIDHTSTAKAV